MTAGDPPPAAPAPLSSDTARVPLLVVGVLALLGGMALVAAPLLAWHSIDFGGFGALSRNGFGTVSYDGPFDDDLASEDAEFDTTGDDEDMSWILGPVPDGVPIVLAGGIVAGQCQLRRGHLQFGASLPSGEG